MPIESFTVLCICLASHSSALVFGVCHSAMLWPLEAMCCNTSIIFYSPHSKLEPRVSLCRDRQESSTLSACYCLRLQVASRRWALGEGGVTGQVHLRSHFGSGCSSSLRSFASLVRSRQLAFCTPHQSRCRSIFENILLRIIRCSCSCVFVGQTLITLCQLAPYNGESW